MALDLDRYRGLFLEEASEHLADMSRALLGLEKDAGSVECIDTIFRMAHSIKSMAATLSYDPIAELAHALEDHMESIRAAARAEGPDEMALLFSGLEGLERMLEVVRESGESPPPRPDLILSLSAAAGRAASAGERGAAAPVLPEPEPSSDGVPKKKA